MDTASGKSPAAQAPTADREAPPEPGASFPQRGSRHPGKPGRKKGGHDAGPRVRRSFGPYSFDGATAREIIKHIKVGCPVPMAAGVAGVGVKTLYDWLRMGKKKDAPEVLRNFRSGFKAARHFAGVQDVKTLFSASIKGNIEAAKWRLSHRYPEYYSSSARIAKMAMTPGGNGEIPNPIGRLIDAMIARRDAATAQKIDASINQEDGLATGLGAEPPAPSLPRATPSPPAPSTTTHHSTASNPSAPRQCQRKNTNTGFQCRRDAAPGQTWCKDCLTNEEDPLPDELDD